MAALTKNTISITVRDKAKHTKIWDRKGYKSQITNMNDKTLNMVKFLWLNHTKFSYLVILQVLFTKSYIIDH